MNIVLSAGRMTATTLLRHPARMHWSRSRNCDGLLRRNFSADERRTQAADMTRKSNCPVPPVDNASCTKTATTPPPASSPPCGGDTSSSGSSGDGNNTSNRNMFVLLAAAGVAALGGLAYYLIGDDDGKSSGSGARAAKTAGGALAGIKEKPRVPASSLDIPKHVPYLLVGGGTASFAAFRAIKSADPKAKVLVITDEIEMPYMRPPLSKEMWLSASDDKNDDSLNFKQWNGKERSLFFEPADFYLDPTKLMDSTNGGVAIVRGYTVRRIDVCGRTAVLADGTEIGYDECLLATGSRPRVLAALSDAPPAVHERVHVFKTVADFERLRASFREGGRAETIAVIGGGFLGSELSCALAKYGRETQAKVYQVFRESGNMGRVLPKYLSEWTSNRVREEGVTLVPDTQVESAKMQDGRVRLKLMNGQHLLVDRVVVAVGSEPDTHLAKSSGLEVDRKLGGYVVNAELEARRHLYVAGDAACFYDTNLGRRRVEHHDHAVVSGRLAGENMAGMKKPYKHQSMFWSDIGPKVGFEAIGIVDSNLPTVGVFARASDSDQPAASGTSNLTVGQDATSPDDAAAVLLEAKQKVDATPAVKSTTDVGVTDPIADAEAQRYGKGVVFYLRDERVVGVVLWNVFNRINTARAIVNENKKWDDLNELAKLFEIHT